MKRIQFKWSIYAFTVRASSLSLPLFLCDASQDRAIASSSDCL